MPQPEPGSQKRELDARRPRASEFVRGWRAFLRDDRAAPEPPSSTACRIAFLPHPNLQPVLHAARPARPHRAALSYDGADVQEYFARARVLVTDYSSVAFNAAYLERPVVYFQFDADEVLAGGHVGRAGYFDYDATGSVPW